MADRELTAAAIEGVQMFSILFTIMIASKVLLFMVVTHLGMAIWVTGCQGVFYQSIQWDSI